MFRLISRPDPAPMAFPVTDDEALDYGQCVKFAGGKLTAATAADAVAGVTAHAVAAGTGNTCRIILVDPEQVWEADYVGTPASGFVVGANSADLNPADTPTGAKAGVYINAADVVGGPCSVLKIDSGAKKCWVKFKNRQLT